MAQINAVNCNKENLNLGIVQCEAMLKDFKSFILTPKTWKIPLAELETLDLATIVGFVQEDIWQPVLNSVEFLNNTPDPTTKEYTGGIMSVIRNGKPQYSFEFDNGIGFHKAAYSKNSFNQYNVLIIDSAGTIVGATTADGENFTGLSASMVNTRTYVPQVGDETAKTLIEFQLSNEEQFNKRMAIITVDQSGVDINSEILAVVGVTITGTANATTATVQVNAVNNTIFGIQGLEAGDFSIVDTTTDSVVNITSVAEGTEPGSYVITATFVVGNVITISTAGANDTAIIGDNQLYRGVSAPITVTA